MVTNISHELRWWERNGYVGHRIPSSVLYPNMRKAEQDMLSRQLLAAIRIIAVTRPGGQMMNKMRVELTEVLARAAAKDAANAQMRKAGRKKWNIDDWNLSCQVLRKLWPIPEENDRS
jgi:hypothetical protein